MELMQQDHLSGMDLQVDGEVKQHLNDAAKWGKFIAISVFIISAIMLITCTVGLTAFKSIYDKFGNGEKTIAASVLLNMGFNMIIAIVFFIVLIFAIIYYFLFNFSVKIKTALMSDNVEVFNKAISSLKTFFIITTILAIITLLNSIYTLF